MSSADDGKDRAAVEIPATPRSAAAGGRKGAEYPPARLLEHSHDFLGQPPEVVAGALHGLETETISIADAQKLVKDFLNRPVAVDTGEEG